MEVSVTYAQSLSGQRWKLYSPWTRLMPYRALDQLGNRLPVRQIWQGGISCGDVDTSLSVVGGHPQAQWTGMEQNRGWYVASATLTTAKRRQDLIRGQLVAVALVADLLPTVAQELKVLPHQLSVGLAVGDFVASYWIAGLEYSVRSITLLGTPRQRNMPVSRSGLVVRQLQVGNIALDVDVLLIAPECLAWASSLSLRRRTAVVITDGSPCVEFVGCSLLTFQLPQPSELPSDLLAGPEDLLPLNEAIVLSSYLARSRSIWSVRVPQQLWLMRRALEWSEWGWRWELTSIEDEGIKVAQAASENRRMSSPKGV